MTNRLRTVGGLKTARAGRRFLLGATALAGACIFGDGAWAQVSEQTGNSGAAGSAGSQVQAPSANAPIPTEASTGVAEVVVTAQRRSERLQDVPIAVTAVTSEDLVRNHIDNASRLEFVTPASPSAPRAPTPSPPSAACGPAWSAPRTTR